MQPCIRIYYSTVHWRLNMFRGAYRSSSGALTVFAASGLHTHVVTGRSQVWVGTQTTRLHLVGYFYWVILRCTDPWILNPKISSSYFYIFLSFFLSFLFFISSSWWQKVQDQTKEEYKFKKMQITSSILTIFKLKSFPFWYTHYVPQPSIYFSPLW